MLHYFRLLLILINIDEKNILNSFRIENPNNKNVYEFSSVFLQTIYLIIEGLWDKVQNGLSMDDIENILFFLLFIRFLILSIRYNLKTSFYISCIALFSGYLWYRHLIDIISMYQTLLVKFTFFKLSSNDLKLQENPSWYNPGQVIYYGIIKAIININSDTNTKYYIDPISMFIANLKEPIKSTIVPVYYKFYNEIIPKIYEICSKFWNQLSGVAAYALVTRIGKRYCPYLVRWHWTFLLIISMFEQIFIYFIYRVYYFQSFVLLPQFEYQDSLIGQNLIFKINCSSFIISFIILVHVGFLIFGLFHAISGQYFYIPFFVENTELHIGPRPKDSIYSGGNTAWQNKEERKKYLNQRFPKLWYGWFGNGTRIKTNWKLNLTIKKFLKKIIKRFKR